MAHVLQQTVGRAFQATCDADLGDGRCRVDLDAPAFRATGAIFEVLRDRAFLAAGLDTFAAGWFSGGTVEWTSGSNSGRRAEVMLHELANGAVSLVLLETPVRPLAFGDAFILRAGCDKRLATCHAKFANVANFRGFPHIPGQDAVIRYATKDGAHEGSVL